MILTPTNRYGFTQYLTLKIWPKLNFILRKKLRKYRGIKVEILGKAITNNVFLHRITSYNVCYTKLLRVSLVRFRYNDEDFRTEWDVKRISKTIQTDQSFKELLIEFFIGGRNSRIGAEIPLYYMRNFKLTDSEFIQDLTNFKYVERILNDNEIQGKYSNEVGAHVERIIQSRLDQYKANRNNFV